MSGHESVEAERHEAARMALRTARRIVVKVGSAVLAGIRNGVDKDRIADLASSIAALRKEGRNVALVSSGAVAAGTFRLGWKKRPEDMAQIQAAAAVGQGKLIRFYTEAFSKYDIPVGQMLLTRDCLDDRERYLNSRNTLNALFEAGAVPVINENDTVMTEELQFGDNDQLSSMVAGLADAELLVILSDIDGLHEKSPAEGESPLISCVERITPEIEAMAGVSTSGVSRGGMASKLSAARAATGHGACVVLASGKINGVLGHIVAGDAVGTCFLPAEMERGARKRWLTGHAVAGTLTVDDGAARALVTQGKSLLPVGVVGVDGTFGQGDAVRVVDRSGREIARGLSNFSADEMRKACGVRSSDLSTTLGHTCAETAIHRDNLVVLD